MIQTWNKFCFTGGYIEANVSLPGLADVAGLWPAIWYVRLVECRRAAGF